MRPRIRRAALGLLSMLGLVACAPGGHLLLVNVRTDLVPGQEFQQVAVELGVALPDVPAQPDVVRAYRTAAEGDEYLPGSTQVAALDDVEPGVYELRVSLIGYDAERSEPVVRLARRAIVEVRANLAITMLITRSCETVICPQEGDPPEATECQAAECVDPRCTPETPQHCPVRCELDEDCPAESVLPCHAARCVEGACYGEPLCVEGEYCHDAGACEPTICRDAPPEAVVPCGEFDETCVDGACVGPCTGQPDDTPCGDGGEVCVGGACVGPCTGAPDGTSCGTAGEVCTAGTCLGPCTGQADGTRCGSTERTAWGQCREFGGPCDETGSQTRQVTTRECEAEVCVERTRRETQGCSRNVVNGKRCGGRWLRCCDGTCRDLRTNRFCGSCRVDCRANGLSCTGTGTGGYSCTGCSTNALCQSMLSSSATCWIEGGRGCECQCGSDGVCSGHGCGGNFFCHDCPGRNFCAPFGGGC